MTWVKSSIFLALVCARAAAQEQPDVVPLPLPPLAPLPAAPKTTQQPWLHKNAKPLAPAKGAPTAAKKKGKPSKAAQTAPASATPPAPASAAQTAATSVAAPAPAKAIEDASARSAAEGAALSPIAVIAAPPPAASGGPLPLPPLKLHLQYGVAVVRGGPLDEAAAADLEAGLRDAAALAPMSQQPAILGRDAKSCAADDDPCYAALAAREGFDQALVAVATLRDAAVELRVALLDVGESRRLSTAAQPGLPQDRAALKASAEAQACALIVPAGCVGELLVDAGRAQIFEGDQALAAQQAPAGARLRLPVGVHLLHAVQAGKAGPERVVAVLREPPAGVSLTVRTDASGQPVLRAQAELAAAPAVAIAEPPGMTGTRPHPAFRKPLAIALASASLLAAGIATVQGARSHSLLSDAESSYRTHGNAYLPSDLDTLRSGNSAARAANALFLAGALFAAAGAGVWLAF